MYSTYYKCYNNMSMNLIYIHFTYKNKNIIITIELYRVMAKKKYINRYYYYYYYYYFFFFCRYVVREVNTEGRNSDSNWGDVEARDNEIKSWVGSGDSNAGDVRE